MTLSLTDPFKEMARTLNFSPAETNLSATFGTLAARLHQIQRWHRITLTTASSLWGQRDYPFTETYLNLIRKEFRGEIRTVDFSHARAAACAQINQWVGEKTRGKIKNVTAPDQFTDDTRLVLCNAIYFKGKWEHQFSVAKTEPGQFMISTNQFVTVPMMHQKADFKTAISDDKTVALLELPYVGNDLAMVILLPNLNRWKRFEPSQAVNLSDLEAKLTTENLHTWLNKLDQSNPHETAVMLPRFLTSHTIDLTKELKSLGMPSAFGDTANFSGMDGTTNLYISDVYHQAIVEVNETGTEATAVTPLVATLGITMVDRFTVDHPFIFLIRDNGSGSILFLGRVIDPTK